MNENEFIAQFFASLLKKPVLLADRAAVWQKVASHIRQTKLAKPEPARDFLFWPRAIFRVAATVLVVILALFVVRGAVNAEPGETFYPVKIAAETVEKALAPTEEAKAKVSIKHARRRLAEVKNLVAEKKDPQVVQQTLDALKITTEEVVEVVSVSEVKPELTREVLNLASEQEQELSKVETTAAPEVKDAVASAISSTKDSLNKLAQNAGDVKGAVTVPASDEAVGGVTSTPKTLTGVPVHKKVKKNPAVKDAPVDADIQIGGVIKIDDESGEPTPADAIDNQ